jgi:two-component system sensor histidine kinase PhoQ
MTRSLGGRLLAALSVMLVLFFGATIAALDNAYQRALERAARDRLDALALGLLATAEPDPLAGLAMPALLPDARFNQATSGVFALVARADGELVWRSASTRGFTVAAPQAPAAGERRFRDDLTVGGSPVFALTLTVDWEGAGSYAITVAEQQASYAAQRTRFRTQLFSWFAAVAALFLVVQGMVLRALLRPLQQVAADVHAVERGEVAALGGAYPAELDALVAGLNALIGNERARLERYRNSLGDLAHSLKTPLAVIRRALEERDPAESAALQEQVARIDEIVQYQLQRAAASGGTTFGAPLEVRDAAERVAATLRKVHSARALDILLRIEPAARFHGGLGDLLELLGNLGDNACKHARSQVVIGAVALASARGGRSGLRLVVADDGPGFAPAQLAAGAQRGQRGDSRTDGHGIGLAIVQDLVTLHGGSLRLGTSEQGGAEVVVELPPT